MEFCWASPLIPGMPKFSLLALGGVTMFAAWKMKPASETEALAGSKAAAAKVCRNSRLSIRWDASPEAG